VTATARRRSIVEDADFAQLLAMLDDGRAFTPRSLAGTLGVGRSEAAAMLRRAERQGAASRQPMAGAYLWVPVTA
jgi:hypothetical protein